MRRIRQHHVRIAIAATLLSGVAVLGCSTDSPTAPTQDPGPGPAPPSAVWTITVEMDPAELVAGTTTPTTVIVRVRRADNNNAPPSGTTIVVTTTLGDFDSLGSGLKSIALALIRGRAEVLLFPGTVVGNALVSAQLESSVGQKSVPIRAQIEPIVASFTTANSNDNLSVVFQDTSTGDPTDWSWDFGDGGKSSEQNPHHLFPVGGDYVVTLTASKTGASDTVSQIVSVQSLVADFAFETNFLTVVFQDLSLGEPRSWKWDFGDGRGSTRQNPTHTYSRSGSYVVSLTVKRENFSDTTSQIVSVDEEEIPEEPEPPPGELFITSIDPKKGVPAGGTAVTIKGQNFKSPLRVFFGGKLADVVSVSKSEIDVLTPPGDVPSEDCDSNDDGNIDGKRLLDLPVDVTVELSDGGGSETISDGFTYDADNSCVSG